jgi:acyl-CoA synthetase (NDP forming)
MHNLARLTADFGPQNPVLSALFGQAAAAGRATLDATEMARLLASFELALAADGAQAAPSAPFEISLRLYRTREFGMIISAGSGGLDAQLDEDNLKKDRATVSASTELTSADSFFKLFQRTLVYKKMVSAARRGDWPLPDQQLKICFKQFLALGHAASDPAATFTLQQLELNLVADAAHLMVQSAQCELGHAASARLPRPIHKIGKLIHPQSIGVIGVSSSNMNFGRIILRNLMGSGYAKEHLLIIRAGESEIDGVKCVESLKALEHKLDLLIVAVAASAVYALVDEIIETDAVESVMLIPGGLGETAASQESAAALAGRINAVHNKPGGGPIFLGANCLGVVSHPGLYDSWFIPLERLPKPPKKPERNSVLLSQSGAFMITRISQNPWLDPRYMLALGNQTDLTHGDLLNYFAELPEVETFGIYIEGFKDLDGLDFAKAVRQAVLRGKQVVVYKSGKTDPGANSVMGHTASIAGDTKLFDSVLRQAGAIVAEDINSFDDLLYIAGALHHKKIGGKRLGGISGAGFEAVGIADSIESDNFAMEMGALEPGTVKKIEEILTAKKLNMLVEVRNPIDINPGADDEAHLQIVEAFLQDQNIDAVVVGMDPTAPAMRSLETSTLRPGFDLTDLKSSVHLMPQLVNRNDKPVVGIIDGGTLYDAMAAKLMDQGVCVFRNCARGTKALVRYFEARLNAESLIKQSR